MRVTLTFDNGPHPVGTPLVLEHLARRRIPAIFFVVGERTGGAGKEVLRATADAGHLIGNHTWSHTGPLGELTVSGAARDEVVRTQQAIAAYAAQPPLFRPVGADPGGVIDDRLLNAEAVDTLREGSFTVVLWNVLPYDWQHPETWPEEAIEGCRRHRHAVVVLHDAYPDAVAALPGFLDQLIHAGTEFTVRLPTDCTPMTAGADTPGLTALVRAGPAARHPRT